MYCVFRLCQINYYHTIPYHYRRVHGLPWRSSAGAMYANFGIQNFEAVIRKSTFGFTQRLAKSTNSLIWLLKVHGLYALIYGTSGKRHCTLLQLHEFFFFNFN